MGEGGREEVAWVHRKAWDEQLTRASWSTVSMQVLGGLRIVDQEVYALRVCSGGRVARVRMYLLWVASTYAFVLFFVAVGRRREAACAWLRLVALCIMVRYTAYTAACSVTACTSACTPFHFGRICDAVCCYVDNLHQRFRPQACCGCVVT